MINLPTVSDKELVRAARSVLKPREIRHGFTVGNVGCALVSEKGTVHVGVSIDTVSGIGFCAEHSAIASMITHGELVFKKIVAVNEDGRPIPPCGRCRELMSQIHPRNLEADVIISSTKSVKLEDLLPYPWDQKG